MARADRFTIERVKPVIYSDFTINLDKNPLTGLLARVTNEESVKNSIKNLIKTQRRERFNQPLTGSKLASLLFDPLDDHTAEQIKETVLDTIRTDEPRAQMVAVNVRPMHDTNSYDVSVVFSILNIPEQFGFNYLLKRVR